MQITDQIEPVNALLFNHTFGQVRQAFQCRRGPMQDAIVSQFHHTAHAVERDRRAEETGAHEGFLRRADPKDPLCLFDKCSCGRIPQDELVANPVGTEAADLQIEVGRDN